MLIFPLKKQWYEKIKSGEKNIEYREVKLYWTNRIMNSVREYNHQNDYSEVFFDDGDTGTIMTFKNPMPCILQLGYDSKKKLKAGIVQIKKINGKKTDLNIDKPVYAIHLSNVRESSISEVRK